MKKIKKSKNYIWYILLGIVILLAAIILLPFWGDIWAECPWKDWGIQFISIAMAVLISIYLCIDIFIPLYGYIYFLVYLFLGLICTIILPLVYSKVFKRVNYEKRNSK